MTCRLKRSAALRKYMALHLSELSCFTTQISHLTQHCLHVQAVELHAVEKEIAAHIKKHFDAKYKPTWHCVVGKSFGEHPYIPSDTSTALSYRLID